MTTYTLSKPVEHNGTKYEVLSFREPTVGDLMVGGSFKDETSQSMAVMASICDVPLPAFKKINVKDIKGIMKATSDLMGNES